MNEVDTSQEKINSPNKSQRKPMYTSKMILIELGALGFKIIVIAFIFLLIFSFIFGVHIVSGRDMNPFIRDGDIVLYYRLNQHMQASDVIVFEQDNELEVRRIVAVSGDTVNIDQNGLMVNGAYVNEKDIYENTDRYASGIDFPVTLPEGYVFVLGDSREYSKDSRIYGCIKEKNIYGKVTTVIRRRNI